MNRRGLLKAIAGVGAAASSPLLGGCHDPASPPAALPSAKLSRGVAMPTRASSGDVYISNANNQAYFWDGIRWAAGPPELQPSSLAGSLTLPRP